MIRFVTVLTHQPYPTPQSQTRSITPRFGGNFVVISDNAITTHHQLMTATANEKHRVFAIQAIESSNCLTHHLGFRLGTQTRLCWLGRALSGNSAIAFLFERLNIDIVLPKSNQNTLDNLIRRQLRDRYGKHYQQHPTLFAEMEAYAKSNTLQATDPEVNLNRQCWADEWDDYKALHGQTDPDDYDD